MYSEREFSIWVSDLPSDISDDDFRKTFSTRYDSVVTAKRKHVYTTFWIEKILKGINPSMNNYTSNNALILQ